MMVMNDIILQKGDAKGILSVPIAKSLEDLIVGPSIEERVAGNSWWGDPSNKSNNNSISNQEEKDSTCDRHGSYTSSSGIEGGYPMEDDSVSMSKSISSTFSKAVEVFLSSGCCIIPDVLPQHFVASCKSKVTSDLEFLSAELRERQIEAIESNQEHFMARVAKRDFRELLDRDGGRRDIRFQLDRFPFISSGLVYNPIVYPLVRELLGGGEINLLYAGVMWALPQPKPKRVPLETMSQKWHADGGHLFDHYHLPPHCINVFYPLIDLNSEHGPTEVVPGSHYVGKFHALTNKMELCCNVGSAIIFDYRLNHRGGANFSSENRPILYLCYAKPFFRDAGNTRSDHSLLKRKCLSKSPAWTARILSGKPVAMGEGYEWPQESNSEGVPSSTSQRCTGDAQSDNDTSVHSPNVLRSNRLTGSGERWILFKMNVELPGCENTKVLTVYHGDIPMEVSSQFCRDNNLGEEYVKLLADSISSQISASL